MIIFYQNNHFRLLFFQNNCDRNWFCICALTVHTVHISSSNQRPVLEFGAKIDQSQPRMPPKVRAQLASLSRDSEDEGDSSDASTGSADPFARVVSELKKYMDDKLEPINQGISVIQSDIKSIDTQLKQNTVEIESLKSRVTVLENDAIRSKIFENNQEQRARAASMRFFNILAPADSDNIATTKYVYDHVIKPAFDLASREGVMSSVPPVELACEYGHFLGQAPPPLPPGSVTTTKTRPIILKFSSRHLKSIFCKYKQRVLDDYDRVHKVKSKAFDDLTKTNLDFINRFKVRPDIKKVFYRNGLKMILSNDPSSVLRVHNPFALDTNEATVSP